MSSIQEIKEKLKIIRDEYEKNSETTVKDDCLYKEKMWELSQEVDKLRFQYQQQIIEFQNQNSNANDIMSNKSQSNNSNYIQQIDNSLSSIKHEDQKVQEENQIKEIWRIKDYKDNLDQFKEETKICREEKDNIFRKISNFCLLSKFWILLLLFITSSIYNYTEKLNQSIRVRNLEIGNFYDLYEKLTRTKWVRNSTSFEFNVDSSTQDGQFLIDAFNNIKLGEVKQIQIANIQSNYENILHLLNNSHSPKYFYFIGYIHNKIRIDYFKEGLQSLLSNVSDYVLIRYMTLNTKELEIILKACSNSNEIEFHDSNIILDRKPDFSGPQYKTSIIHFTGTIYYNSSLRGRVYLLMVIKAIWDSSLKSSLKYFYYTNYEMNSNEVKAQFQVYNMNDIKVYQQ